MGDYLVFRLYGPMASWGEIAVGETRHSAAYPSRSALIGLIGAALGITRDDEDGQAALAAGFRFGVKLHAAGHPLRDFHTVQPGADLKKLRYRTRRQELTLVPRHQLPSPMLTGREYRCDSFSTVAVVVTDKAERSLTEVAAALQRPAFPLYLGRKSCPLAAPLAPKVENYASLKAALDAFDADPLPELVAHLKEAWQADARQRNVRRLNMRAPRYYWDEAFGSDGLEADSPASITLTRHDEPTSRLRWQFAPRREHARFTEGQP
ncbi:MAG: type I-E CRISPR-associated protein Cas5/CasD [Rhodocyclaceae bacterium]|nr:type I-E CRISPR-associated protein Cas5/CasD [Rhodocyclaceae bacterium]